MNSSMLHNGKIITATEYIPERHGLRLFCIDKGCKAPLIFVPGTEHTVPHYKTTGKNNSKHSDKCGFFKPLSFEESLEKVEEYQTELLDHGIKETIIKLNLSKIDPDYDGGKKADKDESEKKKKDPNEIKIKQESSTPNSIGSLKAVVKLFSTYEPDMLASILVSVKGKKVPISQLILSYEKAHELLWSGQAIDSFSYFVFGTIEQVVRREKVYYLNFKPLNNNVQFSIVIFDKYFKHFTYNDEQLIGRNVLVWGGLRKNTFQDKNTSEIIIKSNKYLEFLPSSKK
jgi:hypothetical protein